MKYPTTLLCLCITSMLSAQQWVDTAYSIQTIRDIPYGIVTDFAGNQRTVSLDISLPVNDQPPACGRPLLVMVHGGAFLAGRKDDQSPSRIRSDFAKRGYASASVQYRLGQFQTDQEIHCNAGEFGLEWDCLNMTDTSEWYRAFYRGVQDVHGAIRYLMNHADTYQINPENIFVVGESAGGFIALGVGFIDDMSEVLQPLTGLLPDAPLPHSIYEEPCIQNPLYNLDTSLASMDLARPDLGNFEGVLNQPAHTEIAIKGVGNLFGAVFNNIFSTTQDDPPALYLFHQPADLIVPFNAAGVLAGYAACATQFPFGCQWIINRPRVYGSNAIKSMLEELGSSGSVTPEYYIDFTQNNATCAEQIFNPALGGHALDNYWLRMTHMATFFAEQIDSCGIVSTSEEGQAKQFSIYPNPVLTSGTITIIGPWQQEDILTIHDVNGIECFRTSVGIPHTRVTIPTETFACAGVYFCRIQGRRGHLVYRVVVHPD